MKINTLLSLSALTSIALASPVKPSEATRSLETAYVTKTMAAGRLNPSSDAIMETLQMIAPPPTPPAFTSEGPVLSVRDMKPRDGVYGDYQGFILAWHNVHRQNHSVPDLVYSPTLAGYAATLSSSCVYGHNQTIGGGGYGQNIGALGSNDPVFSQRVPEREAAYTINKGFYNGEFGYYLPSYYGQSTPDLTNFEEYGHLTQVIWKSTTTVGCATSYCPAGTVFPAPFNTWYTVCNYGPAGNVLGYFDTNVLRPNGAATSINIPDSI